MIEEDKKLIKGSVIPLNSSVAMKLKSNLNVITNKIAHLIYSEILSFFFDSDVINFFALDESIFSKVKSVFSKVRDHCKEKIIPIAISIYEKATNLIIKTAQKASKNSIKAFNVNEKYEPDDIDYSSELALMHSNINLLQGNFDDLIDDSESDLLRIIAQNDTSLEDAKDIFQSSVETRRKHTEARNNKISDVSMNQIFSKASSNYLQSSGIKHFQWVYTFRSFEPREYHLHVLKDGIFEMDNPPVIDPFTGEKGYPAQLIGCKCMLKPIIKLK